MKRTAIITGAYGAIGQGIARGIATNHDYQVVLLGRDLEKLRTVANGITHQTGNPNLKYEVVDVSREQSIRELADKWNGNLHILVNNAGATPRNRGETPEGIEIQWATNVLGYFWMIWYMHKFMKQAEDARIVNVASYWAGGLDMHDPEFKQRRYNNDTAYRQSKQADRMLTVAFAGKLRQFQITVNAAHPGDVNSKLSNNLGYGGHETPDQGAATPVWLATEVTLKEITGKYFEHQKEESCGFANHNKSITELFNLCRSYTANT